MRILPIRIFPIAFQLIVSKWFDIGFEMRILLINMHSIVFPLIGCKWSDLDLKEKSC